jgi:eukaryotic-like serine/threonine-protein kinase
MADQHNLKALFTAAVDVPAEERASFLEKVAAGDADLRRRLEALLKAHADPDSFLAQPAVPFAAPFDLLSGDPPLTEGAGTVIGPYKLLQQIGEGGMGVVFMAEQLRPVQRVVALKIIKPGMDTRQVIGRLEAERQALALMDHPNIAKVIDAGATESGRPYFVMELVKGIPITKYCDENHLTSRQRLELFIPVCQAVQHAHQKGIIHRDLKPSNVLVALYDERPVPKVIDFGVAKAIGQKLTELTIFTQFGQIVGTLEYMSPEQAQLNQVDIDTRSDIYSLGVLLYELLTGTTPFDSKRLREAAFDEILRIIRHEDPPKPSTRLSTTEELPSIAANRQSEPRKLTGLVSGELDWIVMKSLEKDRARRYETANGLAMDIERYLANEAVQACPPSKAYRFRKFAQRNKALLVATLLVASALIAGIAISTWQAVSAKLKSPIASPL